MPTEKAHGIQIMEMCQSFSDANLDVELVVTNRQTQIETDPFVYYDMKPKFRIKKLFCLDTVGWGRIGFWFETLTFSISVVFYTLFKKGLFYTRDEFLALVLTFIGKRPVWEAHMGHHNVFIKLLVKLGVRFVVITQGLKDFYMGKGVFDKNIIVAHDGADLDRFNIKMTKDDAKRRLDLPPDKKIILYKGSLSKWKGADTLARSAEHIKTLNSLYVFIGGLASDVEQFKQEFTRDNILMLGNRPRTETPVYQKSADVLIVANTAKEDISKLYNSPMKLFGYMASGVPIIASDLPSIREVLNESNASFFTPDDPRSLAESIDLVLNNYNQALIKSNKALEEVREYSWFNRAEKILNFIQT
jgi:glycosyltransferase involved in cell wall biosynthesis